MRRPRGDRLTRLRQRVRTAVEASFDDDQPPAEIAGSVAGSVPIGVALLGPIDGGLSIDLSLSGNRPVLIRLVVGSAIIAVLGSLLSYWLVRRMVVAHRRREIDVVEELADTVLTDGDEPTTDESK